MQVASDPSIESKLQMEDFKNLLIFLQLKEYLSEISLQEGYTVNIFIFNLKCVYWTQRSSSNVVYYNVQLLKF